MEKENELLEQLLNDSNQMIQVSDIDTLTMMYANKTAINYAVNGDTPYEGKHCYEYMMGLQEQCSFCPMRQIGRIGSFESEVDNGKEIYAVKTKKINWNGVDAFVEYAWNITEIRRSQQIYEDQINRLIHAIHEAQGIFHLDITEDKVISINGSSLEVLHMNHLNTVDDLVRMVSSYIPEVSKQEEFFSIFCKASVLQAYTRGKTELVKEVLSYFDDKKIRPARITCRLLMNPTSNHLEAILYGMDISNEYNERKEHEKQLNKQLGILYSLTRNYKNIYIVDLKNDSIEILKVSDDYDFENLNTLVGKTLTYSEIMDHWINLKVHPDDRERVRKHFDKATVDSILKEQEEIIFNYQSYENDSYHNYQCHISKLEDSDNIILGFQLIDDIIKEHLAQEKIQREKEEKYQKELIEAKNLALKANKAKTEFLLRMSHDIRTPINGIVGMLEISEKFKDDLKKQNEYRQKIKKSSKILSEIVNDVLDMNKLESGTIVLESVTFDLLEISKEVYDLVSKQAEENGIEIIQTDCKTVPYKLIGSPGHFKRLMMNITSNAIKYNKENGKVYITCREVKHTDTTSYIEFKCQDTGIGMSEDFLAHVFEPFAQEHFDVISKYGGTGLGMAIAKNLVDAMGGTITVESEKGVGSTFDIIIPFEIDLSKTEEFLEKEQEVSSIQGVHVLLVEDNEINMEIAKFLLEDQGAIITQAWNGQEAIDVFNDSKENTFDIILMDIMMPILNGLEATKKIRSLDRTDAKNIPIIAMTANAFADDKFISRQAGMNDHICKPLDINLLLKTISRFTQGKKNTKGTV